MLVQILKRSFKNKQGVGVGKFTAPLETSKDLVDFIDNRPLKRPKVSPKVKSEIKKKLPSYMTAAISEEIIPEGDPVHWNQQAPETFMKHMDTSFESFFY